LGAVAEAECSAAPTTDTPTTPAAPTSDTLLET
jgi:hypothetical protein